MDTVASIKGHADPGAVPVRKNGNNDSCTRSDEVSTMTGDVAEEVPGLPRLNYNLWEHKTKLFIMAFLLSLECSLLPIILYYSLWYKTNLRHGICA